MGELGMMKTLVLLLAVAALASAAPSDSIVPEGLTKHETAHAEAQKAINLLQEQGTSSDACSSLAGTTIKEVEDHVNSLQEVIDGLDDGSTCSSEGQDAVDDATNAKSLADQAVKDTADALAEADCAPVDFGSRAYDSLVEGECAWAYSSDAYIGAKAAVNAATTAHNDAVGAAAAATTALEEAVAEQIKLIHECRCKAKHSYATAWASAEEGAAGREESYTKAKHMECVLAGTSAADCTFTVPTVTPRELPADVTAVTDCAVSPVLAMKIGASDHQFWYSDAKWSNSDLFDNGSSQKTDAFNEKSSCITIKDTSTGNEIHWEHDLDASLHDLFNGHHIDSGIALETWHNWIAGSAGQNHCNRQGFQARDDSSWRPVRFGLVMNQENNCGTPDTSIGIGLNTGCCAGSECGCCQNWGSCSNNCREVEVYVGGNPDATDAPTAAPTAHPTLPTCEQATCTMRIYKKEDQESLVDTLTFSSYTGESKKITYTGKIKSFSLSGSHGCKKVKLWDDDKSGKTDNEVYTVGRNSIPSDLRNDIKAVTLYTENLNDGECHMP